MAIEDLSEETDRIAEFIEGLSAQLQAGAAKRVAGWSTLGRGWSDFLAGLEAAGHHPLLLLSGVAAVCLFVAVGTLGLFSLLSRRALPGLSGRIASLVCGAVVSVLVVSVFAQWLSADRVLRSVLTYGAAASAIATVICAALTGGDRQAPYRPWLRELAIAIGIAAAGLVIQASLRAWNAAIPVLDLFGTIAIALPFTVIVAWAYIRHRHAITELLSFEGGTGAWRRRLAVAWPFLVVVLLVLAFLFTQIATTLGLPVRGGPLLLSLLLVLAGPHIDAAVELRSRRAIESRNGELAGALWRTLRILVAATILAMLTALWLLPLLSAAGVSRGAVLMKTAEILLVVLIVAFLWNWVSILAQRIRPAPVSTGEDHGEEGPASRLGTIGPLLVGLSKALLLVLGSLTVLVLVGINVWPLITGFSIFGLAIGLGSQTLVKDIVAGLFFLFDDAFRQGEYIETSGAKGTVEKISIRSVSLRHPRGAVATIPYGQIGKIQNYSREWVIEKMPFRVPLGTDVELVRKLFKQVGKEIAADPVLSADLLEPFKSQGIAALDEGTLVIRGKFKAKAGKQFMIRKAVLVKVSKALHENGIPLIPKPLQMPVAS